MDKIKKHIDRILPLKECSECGKQFVTKYHYLYKIRPNNKKTLWYCSYTCYRKAGGDSGKL